MEGVIDCEEESATDCDDLHLILRRKPHFRLYFIRFRINISVVSVSEKGKGKARFLRTSQSKERQLPLLR